MRFLICMGLMLALLNAQQVEKKPEPPKPDKVATATAQWQKLKQEAEQRMTQIRQLALEIQNMNIQVRDTQLQMREVEADLQSLLCNKGQRLVMSEKPVCSEVK